MRILSGNKVAVIISFFLLWLGPSMHGLSQPGDPGGDPDVPISGIEWLIVAGGIFGIRRVYNRLKKG